MSMVFKVIYWWLNAHWFSSILHWFVRVILLLFVVYALKSTNKRKWKSTPKWWYMMFLNLAIVLAMAIILHLFHRIIRCNNIAMSFFNFHFDVSQLQIRMQQLVEQSWLVITWIYRNVLYRFYNVRMNGKVEVQTISGWARIKIPFCILVKKSSCSNSISYIFFAVFVVFFPFYYWFEFMDRIVEIVEFTNIKMAYVFASSSFVFFFQNANLS